MFNSFSKLQIFKSIILLVKSTHLVVGMKKAVHTIWSTFCVKKRLETIFFSENVSKYRLRYFEIPVEIKMCIYMLVKVQLSELK